MDHTKHKCQYRFPVSFFLTSSVRVRKIAGFRKFTIFSIKWSQCFLQISKKLSDCKTLFYVKKCYSCSTLSPSGAAAGLMVALILKLTFNLPQSSENQSCKRCLTIFEMRSQYMEKAPSPWRKCVLTWRIYYGILLMMPPEPEITMLVYRMKRSLWNRSLNPFRNYNQWILNARKHVS